MLNNITSLFIINMINSSKGINLKYELGDYTRGNS